MQFIDTTDNKNDKICRVCLSNSNGMENIFSQNSGNNISDILMNLALISVG